MNRMKRLTAVLVYLLLICSVLDFQAVRLFDLKQILLVIAGAFCLYFPGIDWCEWNRWREEHQKNTMMHEKNQKENPKEHHKDREWFDAHRFTICALTASTLQTFIVFFILLSSLTDIREVSECIALACRPVFYGICIWSVFGEKEKKDEITCAEEQVKLTSEACYHRYRDLGLSKREAEVALLVEKGLRNAQIAEELYISETTVKKHISNIFEKLEITGRNQMAEKRKK